ncbi:MAG: hypothetical protein ABSG25_14305 [Bryobacteraceae bacterium]
MPRLPISSPRTRVINFRVTEQEYDVVCAACHIQGGQNLSEFARRATIDYARARVAGTDCLQNQLDTLEQKLSRVDTILDELVSTLKPACIMR